MLVEKKKKTTKKDNFHLKKCIQVQGGHQEKGSLLMEKELGIWTGGRFGRGRGLEGFQW